jgi:pyridine nucleotide-disulfide oxidoreductase family protein
MAKRSLLLLGGGHSHVGLLRAFLRKPPQDLAVTLVSETRTALYSGALPGHLAGLLPRTAMEIDLATLAQRAGASFMAGRAIGLDRMQRQVLLADGRALPYDILAINTGIRSDLESISEDERFIIPVKPIDRFLQIMNQLKATLATPEAPRHIAVIGGGPAGVELSLALRAFAGADRSPSITLLSRSGLLPRLNAGARRHALRALARHDINWLDGFDVIRAGPDGLMARDGRRHMADRAILATATRAPGWLAASGLACTADGSVQVRNDLSVLDDPHLFVSGDAASMIGTPLEKAGVHPVRQGPVLAETMHRLMAGQTALAFRPQPSFLTILDTGDGRAIAARGRWFAWEGRAMAWWKRWLDRRFVAG